MALLLADEVLFKVTRISDGHEYVIYPDGKTEGFGDDPLWIENRFPLLLDDALTAYSERNGMESNEPLKLSGVTSATTESTISSGNPMEFMGVSISRQGR